MTTNPGGHCPRCNAELTGVRNQVCLTCEEETVTVTTMQPEPEPEQPGRYEVAFSVDTGPIFANLTESQHERLQDALNTVQALLYAAGGPTNEFASDAVERLMCQLDFPPGTDLSENERRAQAERQAGATE